MLRGFVLQVATSGPTLPFHERNAITTAGFIIRHSARVPRSDVRLFLVFIYIWQEDVAKILKVPEAPCNENSNVVNKRNHLMYYFLITIHLYLASFYAKITLKSIYLGEMLIEQNVVFELEVLAPWPYMYSNYWLIS